MRKPTTAKTSVIARAFCNNEVAYLAWRTAGPIEGCLGFSITRVITSGANAGSRRTLPTWVAFHGQSNPDWGMQDAGVWPIQKFAWRDLTLRRLRDGSAIRDPGFDCHYEITPVGLQAKAGGRKPVAPPEPPITATYVGDPIPLFVCGPLLRTNDITVTSNFGPITATFNNGILSTQNLRQLLGTKPGLAPSKAQVSAALQKVGGQARTYLAGDILPLLRGLFERAERDDLRLFAALYELNDPELIALIQKHRKRTDLILTTAGHGDPAEDGQAAADKQWDTTNQAVRPKLHTWLGSRMQDRMFNTAARIGHNKFVVLTTSAEPPVPVAVLTGSTNWTFTGLAGQSNNAMLIEDAGVARGHFEFWQRLHADVQPLPVPIGATLNGSKQGPALRRADMSPVDIKAGDTKAGKTSIRSWFSPNTERATKGDAPPPDLADVFAAMQAAKHAIFMLCFNPGTPSVIGQAVSLAEARPELLVQGAVSAAEVLPQNTAPKPAKITLPNGRTVSIPSPAVTPATLDGRAVNQLLMVRASAIRVPTGDLQPEILTTGFAIIHDKIVVIDPMSAEDCVVITGSHNLGYKASYCNDENLVMVRGNQALAAAYAAHVLDVFEHYRLRAVQEEIYIAALTKTGEPPAGGTRGGFLDRSDAWQTPYFDGTKGQDRNYVLGSLA